MNPLPGTVTFLLISVKTSASFYNIQHFSSKSRAGISECLFQTVLKQTSQFHINKRSGFPEIKKLPPLDFFSQVCYYIVDGSTARTESRMDTVYPQIRNSTSGTAAGRTTRRDLLFFVCSLLILTAASLAALAADNCFSTDSSSRNMILQLINANHDNTLRNTDHQAFAIANSSARLSASQVQRLLLRGIGQCRSHISRAPFALLLIWLAALLSLTLYVHAFRHRALSALFHFQIILKTILPVRAGPFFCRTSAALLSF